LITNSNFKYSGCSHVEAVGIEADINNIITEFLRIENVKDILLSKNTETKTIVILE
jgi:hypothetical protein